MLYSLLYIQCIWSISGRSKIKCKWYKSIKSRPQVFLNWEHILMKYSLKPGNLHKCSHIHSVTVDKSDLTKWKDLVESIALPFSFLDLPNMAALYPQINSPNIASTVVYFLCLKLPREQPVVQHGAAVSRSCNTSTGRSWKPNPLRFWFQVF